MVIALAALAQDPGSSASTYTMANNVLTLPYQLINTFFYFLTDHALQWYAEILANKIHIEAK